MKGRLEEDGWVGGGWAGRLVQAGRVATGLRRVMSEAVSHW